MNCSLSFTGITKVRIRPGTVEPACRWIDLEGKPGEPTMSILVTGAGMDPPVIEVVEVAPIEAPKLKDDRDASFATMDGKP